MNVSTQLLPHQLPAVEKLAPLRIGALFMDMGTGKSRTAIELVKRRQLKIWNVMWFCPVSLKQTIAAEIRKHTDCGEDDIHPWNGSTNQRSVPDVFWHIVGIESMSASRRVILTVNKVITEFSMVIVDESSYIKGHRSARANWITRISARARYRLILTGTPISQGVVDLYSQMRFLHQRILGYASFYSFAHNHLEYSDKYPGMIVRSHNTEWLAAKIHLDLSYHEAVQLTVLMNRIKGMHQVERMSDLIVNLEDLGLMDEEICKNLGMEPEEYLRLKQQLGIAHSFRNHEYSKAWE